MSVAMAALLALTSAGAAEQALGGAPQQKAWWAGEWGVDPSRSDDPTKVIEQAYVGPTVSSQAASQYSPDGQGDVADVDAAKRKLLYKLMSVLGRSGRMSLADETDGAVRLGWGDGDPLRLEPGAKWTKVVSEDGDKYKIRVREEPDWLMVERKVSGAVITETFVAPNASQPSEEAGDLVVVVSIVGSELDSGIEFRRVYRSL
jgi:hypothetical protein